VEAYRLVIEAGLRRTTAYGSGTLHLIAGGAGMGAIVLFVMVDEKRTSPVGT
jgi:hypothetical protein